MKWERGKAGGKDSDWFIQSDNGYKIAKYVVMKEPKYAAFAPGAEPLGARATSKECKQLCEEHYEQSRKAV
jgi:hypothetical protein